MNAKRFRTTFLLWLFVVLSAISVVYFNYLSRNAFIDYQDLRAGAQSLEVEWGRLLIQRSSSASITRMESEAEKKLAMHTPEVKEVVLVKGVVQ